MKDLVLLVLLALIALVLVLILIKLKPKAVAQKVETPNTNTSKKQKDTEEVGFHYGREKADKARRIYNNSNETQKDISERLGVSQYFVSMAVRNLTHRDPDYVRTRFSRGISRGNYKTMTELDEKEKLVQKIYKETDLNQTQVGEMFGLSQMQVSRIIRK